MRQLEICFQKNLIEVLAEKQINTNNDSVSAMGRKMSCFPKIEKIRKKKAPFLTEID